MGASRALQGNIIVVDGQPSLAPLSVGFVFELDNIRTSAIWRADAMLEQVVRQIGRQSNRLVEPAQFIIVYDPSTLPPSEVEGFLAKHDLSQYRFLDFQLIAKEGLGYYAQKNYGAKLIQRDLIFLIDSDIVVEDEWFERLVAAFDDPSVAVAFGNVRLESNTFFERAFALSTPAFSMNTPQAEREEVEAFLANNVAFRKSAFQGDFFPGSEAYRGHCRIASDRITEAGGKIHRVNSARGMHPAPNGVRHFVLRALVEGHDEVVLTRAGQGPRWKSTVVGSCARLARSVARSASRILGRTGRSIGLRWTQIPGALCVAVAYFGLRFCGEVATLINPHIIRDNGIH